MYPHRIFCFLLIFFYYTDVWISITWSRFSWLWASTIEGFRNAGSSIDSSGAKEDLWCVVSSIHDTFVVPSVIIAISCSVFLFQFCYICFDFDAKMKNIEQKTERKKNQSKFLFCCSCVFFVYCSGECPLVHTLLSFSWFCGSTYFLCFWRQWCWCAIIIKLMKYEFMFCTYKWKSALTRTLA